MPAYLETVRAYYRSLAPLTYEVIVVDDGSEDDLAAALEPLTRGWPEARLIRCPQNRGKGAAVRTGMLAASGLLLLFTDADGATPIAEEAKLRAAIEEGADIAVGSRRVPDPSCRRKRNLDRSLYGYLFARIAHGLVAVTVADPQCGFKMFRREPALVLFRGCRENGFIFDLEILLAAGRLGFRIAEVPVRWRERPGSKVRVVRDSLSMIAGLWRLRRQCGGGETKAHLRTEDKQPPPGSRWVRGPGASQTKDRA